MYEGAAVVGLAFRNGTLTNGAFWLLTFIVCPGLNSQPAIEAHDMIVVITPHRWITDPKMTHWAAHLFKQIGIVEVWYTIVPAITSKFR